MPGQEMFMLFCFGPAFALALFAGVEFIVTLDKKMKKKEEKPKQIRSDKP